MTVRPHTIAVVVTFKPDIALFTQMLRALVPQVDGLVLVDNGSGPGTTAVLDQLLMQHAADTQTQILFQPKNGGIGQAQNVGIALAKAMNAAFVLLMDQDSRPAPDMVEIQHSAFAALQAQNLRPAVIGPNYTEPGRPTTSPLPADGGDTPQMRSVISSGMLMPLHTFDAIGPFDAGLFVDFVDIEWCFRAQSLGYRCFAARKAQMHHQIGGPALRFLGRNMAVHSPERSYYQMRNILLLARRPTTPRLWAMRTIGYILGRSIVLTLLTPPRRSRATLIAQAFWHGFQGITGPRKPPMSS